MKDLLPKLEERLLAIQFADKPQNLYEPIRYLLSLGGKRLRPMLVLLGYSLKNDDPECVIDSALAIEVFHNFTLMHDDIMDEAPLRRGKPTVHEKWNSNVAVLSGDAMFVKVYDLLLHAPHPLLPAIIARFNKCALEVCEGQQFDMDFEACCNVSEAEYLNMIRLKTAVLLGFSLEYGGMLAEMNEENLATLRLIGEKAGIGFQLMDDLLDVYGDQAKFGKQVGGDIASNKKTYLLIKALELSNENQRSVLNNWLSRETFDVEEKVNAVKNIYDEIGIYKLTYQKMNVYYDEAFGLIEELEVPDERKQPLLDFFVNLIKREK